MNRCQPKISSFFNIQPCYLDDFASRVAAKKAPPKKLASSDALFDSMLGDEDKKPAASKPKPAPKKKVNYRV